MTISLTKLAETSQTITVGWAPVPGAIGYRFLFEHNPKLSHTWDVAFRRDPAFPACNTRYSKTSGKLTVEALSVKDSGVYPPQVSPVGPLRDKPPGWPGYAGFQRVALNGRDWLELPDDQDFLLTIGDYIGPTGPQIMGGRRVVAIGGRIIVTGVPGQVYNIGIAPRPRVDVSHHYYEGLLVEPSRLSDGRFSTMLHDGIAQRGARGTATFQNCRMGPMSVKAGTSDQQGHSDAVQFQGNFYGQFRADKMTSLIDYTAIMVSEWEVTSIDLSRWNFLPTDVNPQYAHQTAFYADNPITAAGVRMNEVYFHAKPGATFAAGFVPQSLSVLAKQGDPPGGDFVKAGEVGLGYVSPGYA